MRAVVLETPPGRCASPTAGRNPNWVPARSWCACGGVGICGSDLALISHARRVAGLPVGARARGVRRRRGGRARRGRVPGRPARRHRAELPVPALPRLPVRAHLDVPGPGARRLYRAGAAGRVRGRARGLRVAGPRALDRRRRGLRRTADGGAGRDQAQRHQPGGNCLVVGAGSQGGLLCLALAARGVTPHVLEPDHGRLELAVSLGAKAAGPDDAGFDAIFETSGAEAALGEAVSRAAPGATVVLIGLGGQATRVDTRLVVRRQLALRGSLIYDHPGDFAATLASAIAVAGADPAGELSAGRGAGGVPGGPRRPGQDLDPGGRLTASPLGGDSARERGLDPPAAGASRLEPSDRNEPEGRSSWPPQRSSPG